MTRTEYLEKVQARGWGRCTGCGTTDVGCASGSAHYGEACCRACMAANTHPEPDTALALLEAEGEDLLAEALRRFQDRHGVTFTVSPRSNA